MAAIAVLMGIGFVSCSKDGENSEDFSNQKKLTKVIEFYDDDEPDIFTLYYDSNGHLSSVKCVDENGTLIEEYASYVWGDDFIKRTDDWPSTTTLEDGLMQTTTIGHGGGTYTYNKSNRVTRIEQPGELGIRDLIWDNDKLIRVIDENVHTTDITYKEKCKKGFSPIVGLLIDDGNNYWLSLAHPELMGARTTQLPSTVTWGDSEDEKETYSYEFDIDGYVSKIVILYSDSKHTFKLTWE